MQRQKMPPLVLLNSVFHPGIMEWVEKNENFKLLLYPGFEGVSSELESEVEGLFIHPAGSQRVRVDETFLARFPKLKIISNQGVGVDHICLESCRRRGIAVGNTPGLVTASTADMAWALCCAWPVE